jgi:O-antigen ligase
VNGTLPATDPRDGGPGTRGVPPRRIQDLLGHPSVFIVAAGLVGLVFGLQFFQVNPRIVKTVLAVVLFFAFARYPTYVGVGVFLIFYPFPTDIFIGNTNFIFVVLLASIWMIKVGLGLEAPPGRSMVGGGVFLLLLVHFISLIMLSQDVDAEMSRIISGQQYLLASTLFYAVFVNSVTTPKRLNYIFQVMTLGALVIYLIEIVEFTLPTLRLIPDWYLSFGRHHEAGGRAEGVFRFHALLADSAAVNVLLQLFLMTRTRKLWRRFYHLGVALLAVVMITISVNRGGFIILLVGLVLLAWHLRRDLKVAYLAVGIPVLAMVLLIGEQLTRGRFEEVSLFLRLSTTRLETFMPDNRADIWEYYIDRILESPFLGHGPYLDETAIGFWPHNAYLFYAYTTGLAGLGIFLWIVVKVVKRTHPPEGTSWVRHSFVRGSLLLVHVMFIQFAVGQMRTDHQRGNVAIFFFYGLLGLASAVWSLAGQERRRARLAAGAPRKRRKRTRPLTAPRGV